MPTTPTNIKTTLIVGMEIHVELATRSKMWTAVPNVAHRDYFDAQPNTLLDPVVIGMPGTLPVINEQAVEMAVRVGLALGCQIARKTKWDRKSYYYPDLPKNYQISQYDQPICGEGSLEIPVSNDNESNNNSGGRTIRITRAHLEEDAGKLMHEAPGGTPIDHSIVDLNRAGTPLLEIVTEPDFRTADQAVTFGQNLRHICRHLAVTEGDMQRGHMRFEPNINVIIEKDGQTFKTPIVEIKNLNSFKAVHGAITHEYQRQIDAWLEDGKVMGARSKSTRGWDDQKGITTPQREKEDEDEYRYFPDPDLVTVAIDDDWLNRIKQTVTELPDAKRNRYINDYNLSPIDAGSLLDDPGLTNFYESTLAAGTDPKRAAAMLLNYAAKLANERNQPVQSLGITPQQVKDIADLSEADKIGSSAAAELFAYCCDHDDPAESLAKKHSLLQVSDTGALETFVDQVLADAKNAKAIEDIRAGKDKAIGALMGQIMKLSKGQANPKLVTQLIIGKLRG
jgi:aspartyl-tRNA(Asn)/glutamyl-tRNA(Gln) amidotransferase subunit B